MKYEIRGTTLQVVDVELSEGESVYTETGGMSWMSPNIEMSTNAKGGIMSGFGRMLSGESFFMTTYSCKNGSGRISFANEFPGKVIDLELSEGEYIVAQKDAFMFAQSSVSLEAHFTRKLGAGFFGGEGFIMQRLKGPGRAFLELAGEVTEYELGPGEELRVDPGHVAAFASGVDFDITRVKGVANMLFGGEGLFLATLRGPGRVWLQSMPLPNLAARISRYLQIKRS